MVINCDIVVASESATFALPEVKIGVTALAGALPRLVRTLGKQRAAELALTGRTVSAGLFKDWGICNAIVPEQKSVVDEALKIAKIITENSPESVIVTREGLKLGWDAIGVVDASRIFMDGWAKRLDKGENMAEGLEAFCQKRKAEWKGSKL